MHNDTQPEFPRSRIRLWAYTFLITVAWPVGGYLIAAGAVTMYNQPEEVPGWHLVIAVVIAAVIRATAITFKSKL